MCNHNYKENGEVKFSISDSTVKDIMEENNVSKYAVYEYCEKQHIDREYARLTPAQYMDKHYNNEKSIKEVIYEQTQRVLAFLLQR